MIFLFPTFPMRSTEFDAAKILGYDKVYRHWYDRAKNSVDLNLHYLDDTHKKTVSYAQVTLQAHYACIIENVAMAQWASEKFGPCDRASSYSMGLFAALVHLGALDFESTLKLVEEICTKAHDALGEISWAVGAVVDFPIESLKSLLLQQDVNLEITDIYAPNTILFTGLASAVKKVLDQSLQQGASITRLIPLTAPFHTTSLLKIRPQMDDLVGALQIQDPACPLLSSLTQEWLVNAEQITTEIRNNVSAPMDWSATMGKIAQLSGGTIVECGSSHGLTDLSRAMLSDKWSCIDFRDFSGVNEPN